MEHLNACPHDWQTQIVEFDIGDTTYFVDKVTCDLHCKMDFLVYEGKQFQDSAEFEEWAWRCYKIKCGKYRGRLIGDIDPVELASYCDRIETTLEVHERGILNEPYDAIRRFLKVRKSD